MNCDGVRGLLSAYVDGELSAGELLRVEQHLRRCHWCADEVDALRQTIALVASLEEVAVPAAFHLQLHNRLVALGPPVKAGRTATARHAKRQDFRRWAVPAAAAAALVISVAGLNRFNPPMPVPQAQIGERVTTPPAESAKGTTSGELTSNNPSGSKSVDPNGNENDVQNPSGGGAPKDPAATGNTANPDTSTNGNTTGTTTNNGFGETSTKPGAHTASFRDDISEPSSYAKVMQPRASVEVTTAEPNTLAEELQKHFAAATVRLNTDPVSGIRQLLIILPSTEYQTGLAFVESTTGQQAVDHSLPLDLDQMNALWESLTRLDEERAILDPKAEKDLAKLQEEANQTREAYQKLVAMSESGTITVTLKPMKAQ